LDSLARGTRVLLVCVFRARDLKRKVRNTKKINEIVSQLRVVVVWVIHRLHR
jgi:hypothetical protein